MMRPSQNCFGLSTILVAKPQSPAAGVVREVSSS
jgi:hypothetical protein